MKSVTNIDEADLAFEQMGEKFKILKMRYGDKSVYENILVTADEKARMIRHCEERQKAYNLDDARIYVK
jgi:hypothetical protein